MPLDNCPSHTHTCMQVLREGIERTGHFDVISPDDGLPLVAFHLKDDPNRG